MLRQLLLHFLTLPKPTGQILCDSSDISYLYAGARKISYQYAYKGQKSDWFKWLYVGEHTLKQAVVEADFEAEVLLEDKYGQYLARLTNIF